MPKGIGRVVFCVVAVILGCACASDVDPLQYNRVVFVGASITEDWDFEHYFAGYDFRKVIHYDVDKTTVWDRVAALDADRRQREAGAEVRHSLRYSSPSLFPARMAASSIAC